MTFAKYHGAGNDFILIDDRTTDYTATLDQSAIAHLCDRHFGIGADGLMLLNEHPDYDFEMVYYNSDGAPSSMCGNGGRCIVRFAADLGLPGPDYHFLAVDGPHHATLLQEKDWVSLEMNDVSDIERTPGGAFVLDTGSPHYVTYKHDPAKVDVVSTGRGIRNSATYVEKGINVNFVRLEGDVLHIATYERGVEDETLACGTGVTAAVIVSQLFNELPEGGAFRQAVRAKGGELAVRGVYREGVYTELWLEGPAEFVFRGEVGVGVD